MFKAAQFVVRNKVVLVGAAVVAFMVFGRNGDEPAKISPWDTDTARAAAASSRVSVTDKAFGAVAGVAKDYAGVDISSVAPNKLRDDTLNNF
ncbi:MAG: hypothetical protein WCY11_19945, partial [Novosphingobium sp.]